MREPLPGEDLEVAAGGDPAEQAVRSEEVESLRHALARLPGQQRHAFLLREFSGLSYEELADELGVTRPAVESLLFRARQQLRVSLRTALAAVTSAPMSFRDWLAQLFGPSPETPAAAAKLGALAVVAKIAAATAGTAIVAAGVSRWRRIISGPRLRRRSAPLSATRGRGPRMSSTGSPGRRFMRPPFERRRRPARSRPRRRPRRRGATAGRASTARATEPVLRSLPAVVWVRRRRGSHRDRAGARAFRQLVGWRAGPVR